MERRQAGGYVRKGEGILPSDPDRAMQYDRCAKRPPVLFDTIAQDVLVTVAREVCTQNDWRLHQAVANPTHIHLLISWKGFVEWAEVSRTFKRRLGSGLSKAFDRPGPWFGRGGSRKRVLDRKHFDHLMDHYLPRHKGRVWREGDL